MVLFIRRFVYNGYKRPLTTDDFWLLDDSDSAENCIRRLEYEWNKVFKKYKETEENLDENLDANSIL